MQNITATSQEGHSLHATNVIKTRHVGTLATGFVFQ